MTVVTYVEVTVWDGGDRDNHVANFRNQAAANQFIATQKFPEHYHAYGPHTLVIYDSPKDYEANTLEKIREDLLKTLTPLQLKALGLKPHEDSDTTTQP